MSSNAEARAIDIVLFDLGSTLLYFDADWTSITLEGTDALARAVRLLGYQLEFAAFSAEYAQMQFDYYLERDTSWTEIQVEGILRELFAKYGYPTVPIEHIYAALDAMYAVYQRYWRLEEDAVPMLQTVLAAGYHTGLVSNAGYGRDLDRLLDMAGLRPYLESIVISAYAGVRKPHPEIFNIALAPFGAVDRSRVVMVGDLLGADVLGARNAGIGSIWINRRASPRLNQVYFGQVQPDVVVETLAEIPSRLREWTH
ncbi:MAG: HAD family hydrolase, partial [Anaerolineae bacterium]|nr:HAD family hydrolase [Anaerolineae bacterium]